MNRCLFMIKNSTLDYLNTISLFKKVFFLFLVLLLSQSVFSQYSTKHYIAAAPWDYSSDANEFVVSSASGTASVTITKSDGTAITILSVTSGTPVAFRPTGAPASRPANAINTLAGNKRVKIITTCTERIHSPLLARNYVGYQIGIRAMIH